MNRAPWLDIARRFEGTKEVKGPKHNPLILTWLAALGAWWRDDETPWCGVFVGAVLREAGIDVPRAYYRALAWEDWGIQLGGPGVGCVVVFARAGGGHVGFVVGQDKAGNLLVLGGNQGDEVNVRAFPRSRVTAYRWPPKSGALWVAAGADPLPVLGSTAMSTTEA